MLGRLCCILGGNSSHSLKSIHVPIAHGHDIPDTPSSSSDTSQRRQWWREVPAEKRWRVIQLIAFCFIVLVLRGHLSARAGAGGKNKVVLFGGDGLVRGHCVGSSDRTDGHLEWQQCAAIGPGRH